MPWCPVCKNEYVEGKTHCPDCDVDLVEELPEEEEESPYPKMPEDYEFPEDFDPREVLEPKEKPQPAKLYKRPEDRYEDMRSSAWAFLLIGAAGLVVMVLGLLRILTLPFHDFVLFVMTALFLIFIVIGIVSYQNAKKLKGNITSENAFIEEVINWYHTTGSKTSALAELDQDQPEEMLYFQKSEIIRNLLAEQYPQMDQTLLDKLTDDFCEEDFS